MRNVRVLHFDMECRPLSWYGGDWVTKEPTVFSAAYADEPEVMWTWLLQHSMTDDGFNNQIWEMVDLFNHLAYPEDWSVIASGHWVRGFDLPLLNGAAFRVGYPVLESLSVSDTKSDLVTLGGLSKSQENLGSLLELEAKKVSMNTGKWESANRLTTRGIEESQKRCEGDVIQHIEMRANLLPYLGPPRTWSAGKASRGGYVA